MGRQNMRNLIGILKDKASFIRAALSIKRASSSVRVAVLRATTHIPSSPPPDHCIAAVLSLGHGPRPAAGTCVAAVMDRLHGTHDTYVALKCLLTLHHIVTGGSFILRDQLCFYPASGGRNFLNLSKFRDGRDAETWELSSWVRWYAGFLESNLIASRILGSYISNSIKIDDFEKNRATMTSSLNSDLMRDLDVLVGMVEEICRAPDSLNQKQSNLVYEVMNLVGEDYRSTQHHVMIRLTELSERVTGLSPCESAELMRLVVKLEECRERLLALFVNRKRNDAFWEIVSETKTKLVKTEKDRERGKWLVRVEEANGSTRFRERVGGPSQVLRLTFGSQRRGVDRVNLTVPAAVA